MLIELLVSVVMAAEPVTAGPDHPVVHTQTQGDRRQAPNGAAEVLRAARGENAFLGWLTMNPGAKVPLHRDPTEEYIYIVEGGGVLTLDGTPHALTEGSVVYMAAGAQVTFENGPKRTVAVQVFAGPKSADKYDSWKPVPSGS